MAASSIDTPFVGRYYANPGAQLALRAQPLCCDRRYPPGVSPPPFPVATTYSLAGRAEHRAAQKHAIIALDSTGNKNNARQLPVTCFTHDRNVALCARPNRKSVQNTHTKLPPHPPSSEKKKKIKRASVRSLTTRPSSHAAVLE